MCCTVRGDISNAVKGIIQANELKPDDKKLHGIIVETTGMADPSPVAATFFGDMFLETWTTLDGTVYYATKARDRMNPVSSKVTKFSNKSSRDFQKLPSFSALSFCDYHCTLQRMPQKNESCILIKKGFTKFSVDYKVREIFKNCQVSLSFASVTPLYLLWYLCNTVGRSV